MSKTLIAYYSRRGNNYVSGNIVNLSVGNTEVAVQMIEQITNADVFRIEQADKYSDDYTTCTEEAQRDLRANARPVLTEMPESIDEYDTIILAYPNYWGTMPMAVFTFLEEFNFSGKTILPLCTHEGSGMGHSENDIKKLCANSDVKSGLAIQGGTVKDAKSKIEKWLKNY